MSILEVQGDGGPLKIEVTTSTTASEVVDIINAKWPGSARLMPTDGELHFTEKFGSWYEEETTRMERHYRKIAKADKIAKKAEAAQRRAKGGHRK